jgi:hypothetical protein
MIYTLIRESWPKARKPYRCIWCGDGIEVGETHRHEISRYDELQDFRWHRECHDDAQECFRDGDCEFIAHSAERPERATEEGT